MLFVGGDDLLHKRVAHNVRAGEAADGDIVHAVEHLHSLLETGRLVRRQVDLRHIAGDDHLTVESQTGQEHFHLLARGVLRLVKDDEAVVERPAAHVSERRYFDIPFFKIGIIGLRPEHIEERVVQRPQVGIDLALQIAGQEAEPLARFDRGTREDDAVDALFAECRHRRGHGEIRFARTGGADAERYGIVPDGLHIRLLAERFRLDGAPLRRDADYAAVKLTDLVLLPGADHPDHIAHALFVHGLAVRGEHQKVLHRLFRGYDVLRLAGDLQLGVPVGNADVPLLFNDVQILVKRAENIENVLDAFSGNDSFHGFSCILHPVMAGEFLCRYAPRIHCAV